MTQINSFALACLAADLERAASHARAAKMDWHFISECDHLLATARHNLAAARLDWTIIHNGNNDNESKENNK